MGPVRITGSTSPTYGGHRRGGASPLLDAADASYQPIAAFDQTIYFLTDLDAPFGRVIAIDVEEPDRRREIIPEGTDALERVSLVGNRLAAVYLHHARHRLALFELAGGHVMDVPLPGIGKVVDMAGRRVDDRAVPHVDDVHGTAVRSRRPRSPTAPSATFDGRR